MNLDIFKNINADFAAFINLDANNRILLSGKFGSGKTTFVKEFFSENEEYNCFHLCPVNYQVSENGDIFSQLKFDIIFLLIQKYGLSFSDSKIQPIDYLPTYLKNHAYKLLLPILTFKFPSVGIKLYSVINDEIEKFLQTHERADTTENQLVDELALRILNEEGSIYEKNYLTDLIIDKIQELNQGKKSVLILDDLDRLDPKHIFRLLNVFSAHFDYSEEQKAIYGENTNSIQQKYLIFHQLKT